MNLVIDSNRLQSDELRAFLARSPRNVAVLTDYAAMEAYKGDTLASIFKSMEVLSEFPTQVLVLKGTRSACTQRGRLSGLQRRFIDEKQSESFPEFVRHLELARSGHAALKEQLLDRGRDATTHLDKMLREAETTGQMIEDIATTYSKEERAVVRRGEVPTQATVDKIIKNVLTIAGRAFGEHPDIKLLPRYAELPNTFIFRAALCTYLLVTDWAARGGAKNASPALLRNDFVDMIFATYSTYFDGLMTADKKTRRLHTEARVWLIALFDCKLPSGFGINAGADDA